MAKDYAATYNSQNDASAVEQRFYAKLETDRGTLIGPANEDFFYTLSGGSINYSQPFDSSPHRSGRHHTDIIKKKKQLNFSFNTFFNIDETLGAASTAEIDPAIRMLFKSLFGNEDITGGSPVYNALIAPALTFSLFEVGDKWARQARGCFIQGGNMQFPGNGEAQVAWTGAGAEAYLVGIGKSTVDNNGGNTVTLQAGEGVRFPAGSLVMLIEADGSTRSADTAAGSYRVVSSVAGDVVTLSGAPLADADGGAADVYLVYAEPEAPVAINNPVTGLVGSLTVQNQTVDCFRNATLDVQNNHELVDYCYGSDALDGSYFIAGDRVTMELSIEANLNDGLIAMLNDVQAFEAQDIDLVLGAAAGRRFELAMPKIQFPVPEWAVPETGSIPVTLTGTLLQTALDAADEATASFL